MNTFEQQELDAEDNARYDSVQESYSGLNADDEIESDNQMSYNIVLANTVKNGAQILNRVYRPINGYWLVLCFWDNDPNPYVVWRSDENGHTYWGRYHKTLEDAQTTYLQLIRETK